MLGEKIEDAARRFAQEAVLAKAVAVTAESCTGGGISYAITSVAGSSEWFDRGFATYSNDAKRSHLGVKRETLEQCGAVSEETAGEMVMGAILRSQANIGVSVTGIAGPGGATPGKPVGTVCFGFAHRIDGVVHVRTCTVMFEGDRDEVRSESIVYALEGLMEECRKLCD